MSSITKLINTVLPEPQMKYMYNVILPGDYGDGMLIGSRITEITAPFTKIDSPGNVLGNSKWYAAENDDIGSIDITILECHDFKTLNYFINWFKDIILPDGTYNIPSVYKKTIIVQPLKRDGSLTSTLVYDGYFPTSINAITFSPESEALSYQVSFTGDTLLFT